MKNESEKTLKKLHEQSSKINVKDYPSIHNIEVDEGISVLESCFSGEGRVNQKYAKETLISHKYAQDVRHFETNNTMLQDIREGKKIVFNNYKK
ncbi:hypothetical protein J2T56_003190 [Natronobacillus azotifigens]|uniref:Uncharacterized protein n=1 Tax=Natronobacillus azotifigens TaxID=472978 RepID=A0A9J6RFR8_9BACI|nr:hypothetical protein [Natronobacillus azotifigens]MCZ0704610.1 hypothetical protein [Natronobacillus azotifigens]